jgi:uncharacterized protein (TIGR03118 family)
VETNLVSDIPGLAPHTDPALLNPWGFTVSSRGDFLISDNNGGNAALFAADGTALGAPIVMPPPGGSPAGSTGAPTGQVLNASSDFVISEGGRSAPAAALFSTEDGTIIGFNSAVDPSNGILAADQSAAGAVYKGLALGSAGGANYLYAANFRSGTVDVFDTNFALHTFSAGQFADPNPVAGFAPFGIKILNGSLFVTYAKQNAAKHDDVEGPGNGFIDEFDTSGTFLMRFASGTAAGGTLTELNSPWGMAIAPDDFGKFEGALLVGNFGDSHVSAFRLKTGRFLGQLEDPDGQPLVLVGGFQGPNTKGLWGIGFGNGEGGAGERTLFFASGINDEADGLFGMVNAADDQASPHAPILPNLPASPTFSASTIPPNGDLNPYGVAFVPNGFAGGGPLRPGDILVSNFNDSNNQQGTGTTIVRVTPDGQRSLFFQGAAGLGLDTALGVLRRGFVIVGSLPTTIDANGNTVPQPPGSLLILDRHGRLVETLTDPQLLDGPWDLAVHDEGGRAQVFVSNVLNGTVTRIDLKIRGHGAPIVERMTRIASGYGFHADPAAVVVGPTGLAYDARKDILYVASTADNAIFAIGDARDREGDAGTGRLVYRDDAHLHGPLGLALAPNGDLITANGDAPTVNPPGSGQQNELVEFTPGGQFVGQFMLDPGGPGAAFGLAVTSSHKETRLAAVNDNTNMLEDWDIAMS